MFEFAFNPYYPESSRKLSFLSVFIGNLSLPLWSRNPSISDELRYIDTEKNCEMPAGKTQANHANTKRSMPQQKGVNYV